MSLLPQWTIVKMVEEPLILTQTQTNNAGYESSEMSGNLLMNSPPPHNFPQFYIQDWGILLSKNFKNKTHPLGLDISLNHSRSVNVHIEGLSRSSSYVSYLQSDCLWEMLERRIILDRQTVQYSQSRGAAGRSTLWQNNNLECHNTYYVITSYYQGCHHSGK